MQYLFWLRFYVPELWPFCGQHCRQFPLFAGISLCQEPTLRVSQRERIDVISATYRTAALGEVFGFEDSQSSNTGSIPVSATSYHPLSRVISAAFLFCSKTALTLISSARRKSWCTKWSTVRSTGVARRKSGADEFTPAQGEAQLYPATDAPRGDAGCAKPRVHETFAASPRLLC